MQMRSLFEQAIEIDLSLQPATMLLLFGIPCTYNNYRKENFPPKISLSARRFSLVFLITNRIEKGKLPLGYLQNLGQIRVATFQTI